jgi:hypothetical protein
MTAVPQEYFKELREHPDPALLQFVAELQPGRRYGLKELWDSYNSHRGFHGTAGIFKYALEHAGMRSVSRFVLVRPE